MEVEIDCSSRSHDAVISVYDERANVIDAHEHRAVLRVDFE